MKKAFAILLAVLMLIPLLVACTNSKDNDDVTTTKAPASNNAPSGTTSTKAPDNSDTPGSNTDAPNTDPVSDNPGTTETAPIVTTPVTEPGYVEDDLGTMNYNGKKITILYWEDCERTEFEVESISGDKVDDAIRNRNLTCEQRLGVELEWVGTKGNYNNQAAFVQTIETGAVDNAYDILAGYSLTAASIALKGLSTNLNELKYLNFEKPWWPSSLVDSATINDKLFFASGDISTMMLHMMYCVLFNKTMLENHGLAENSNPYDLVLDGTWTLDKMISMCENIYEDTGSKAGSKDNEDVYGYVSTDINFDGLFTGSGLRSLEFDSDGKLIFSSQFTSGKTQDLLEKCVDFFATNNAYGNKNPASFKSVVSFAEGRALFTMDRAYVTSGDTFKAVGEELLYGVVPCPKYDTNQKDYVTMLGFPYTMYSISSASDDMEASSAVLECLGSEGYRQVTPELFETVMKIRYTSDDVAAEMYDIIKENVFIDPGRIFATELSNVTWNVFRNELDSGTKYFSSKIQRTLAPLKAKGGALDKINELYFSQN